MISEHLHCYRRYSTPSWLGPTRVKERDGQCFYADARWRPRPAGRIEQDCRAKKLVPGLTIWGILPSARGTDGTDPTLPEDYGFDTSELRDLLTVMDAQGINRAHVVGHSSGGALAFELARHHADRLDRLILIEPTLIGLLPEERRQALIQTLTGFVDLDERDGPMACLRASLSATGGKAWAALDEETREAKIAPLSGMSTIMAPH